MKNLKTRVIVACGLGALALGLLAVPGAALAATHHRAHHATQQAPQSPPPCQVHFQTGCSGY